MDGNPDVVMFGMMSSMRTGNLVFDLCVCMILPVFFRHFWTYVTFYASIFRHWIKRKVVFNYRRTIEHTRSTDPWRDPKVTHKNLILQTAIRAYIGKQLKPAYPEGEYKLMAVESKAASNAGSLIAQLEKKYSTVLLPAKESYVEIEPGLWYNEKKYIEQEKDEEERKTLSTKSTVTIEFTASRLGGKKKVDEFVQRAYDWYVAEVEKDEEQSRFMYQPLSRDKYATADERSKPRLYKRYQLSEDKTFNSLFFPEKPKLLKLIDQFQNKTGKYAVKGFPHKLGLLLYGPPGTGKTSMVKAMAVLTKRHIISVPLGRVHTNQELMDIMFDQMFKIKGAKKGGGRRGDDDDSDDDCGGESSLSGKHKLKDVIFLLEDVDAASDVVLSREGVNEKRMSDPNSVTDPAKEKEKESEALMNAMLIAQMKLGNDVATGGGDDAEGAEGKGKDSGKKGDWMSSTDKDKLSLGGLLNVLDGVVDSPSRILIMTTNHRERLDPALLRPGRVNLQVHMDYIQPDSMAQMMKHYYPEATASDMDTAKEAFAHRQRTQDFKMSPAEMEQLCAENDTAAKFTEAIITCAVPQRRTHTEKQRGLADIVGTESEAPASGRGGGGRGGGRGRGRGGRGGRAAESDDSESDDDSDDDSE